MQTIRKSIYLGLGGTGVKAVAETKKMFEDSFGVGNIPPHVTFVALDFDRSVIDDRSLATDISADFVQLPLSVNPFMICHSQMQSGKYEWMPDQNKLFIPEFMECGAGQVRSNARLFADLVMPCIDAAVNSAMARVLSLSNMPKGYLVMNDDHVNVYLAMSLAGGTGSALMLMVAQMIHDRYDHARLIGYGVMHSIFQLMDPYGIVTPRIKQNVYASLLELDYLQSATYESKVVHSIAGKKVQSDSPLFDEFYVVDNKTQLGGMIDNVESLCNAVGCSMYYGATDVGKFHSIDWRKRGLNWGKKTSWVHSFGVCQVVYDGAEMETLYRKKVVLGLLRLIKGDKDCPRKRVNEWTERVNLREDGDEYNKLIDWICPADTIARIRVPSLDSVFSGDEIVVSLNRYSEKNSKLWSTDHVSAILMSSVSSLKDEVARMLQEEGGVRTAVTFLKLLEEIFSGYKSEMETEAAASREEARKLEKNLEIQMKQYDMEYRGFFSKLFGRHRRTLNSVGVAAAKRVRASLQVARREDAITVFAGLINEIRSLAAKAKAVENMILTSEKSCVDYLHQKELERAAVSLFEINLSHKDAAVLNVEVGNSMLVEFMNSFKISLLELEQADFDEALMDYTYTLSAASRFRDRHIMDIIEDMDEEEYEELKQNILRKSAPLLSLQDRGLMRTDAHGAVSPISNMLKVFYINAYKKNSEKVTRFEGDGKLLAGDNVRVAFIPSDCDTMKQRIFIHRVDSAIMPYCIESVDMSMANYPPGYNPHYDSDLYELMRKKGHTLQP